MGRRHFRESIDISDKASQASTPSPVEIPGKQAAEVTPTVVEPEISEAHEVPFEDLGDVDEDAPTPPLPAKKPAKKRVRKSRAKAKG